MTTNTRICYLNPANGTNCSIFSRIFISSTTTCTRFDWTKYLFTKESSGFWFKCSIINCISFSDFSYNQPYWQ
uniref:DNA-directed RNA polymerase beta' subunit n=1 Tax=Heterosigma akashiwo TaxID=2829 RepID=A0A224AN76_HETAK|nr:DNA-directed RNA polymerase beta' subunit [Heterosigma akashiwo]BBA18325.1 DNA-directed RNA polymerase beta' subunit [Heterosigma akashiwo]BBA18464.1 DNA-directed RNA polymerase beta' subunit [Heterosigma akashiwo]BBA18602.1 DNA-directed RNA polymerase beta' subunit [Heterosigma akashiwo]BBA18741.1 DNA-directed RNA polymerase beta' subunit [Heterosigma akashiwo]